MAHAATHPTSPHEPPLYRRRHPFPGGLVLGVGLILLAVAVSVLLLWDRGDGPARIGAPMPDFTLTSLAGTPVRLADYGGQVVLVNAWGTWCSPCRAEMPTLNDFYRLHQSEGFVLLAVNSGDSQAEVAGFISQAHFTFPVLLDPGETVLDRLGVRGLPTSFVVGRDGLLKDIHVGEFTPQELAVEVAPLLQQLRSTRFKSSLPA